ncbi:acid protease [Rhizopogon vinicolor AM-OR11-026]|uniref:Acid protease n=1 Tax=Rhizopogon vinicolor AM-OR11-026 TaxID=1314800 RepID=A0A1B7MXR2_9AGAM|nr:acid protease [Rhizopogon vinicolor AM-OR11-026]
MMHSRTKRDNGVPLTNQLSTLWYGEIGVGTPEQKFSVAIDTGSSDLFLPSVVCDQSCQGHRKYNATQSSTSNNESESVTLAFRGGATVVGEEYSDVISIGGYEATNQSFVAASKYSYHFSGVSFLPDGLVGLAFKQISVLKKPTIFETLSDSGVLPKKVFSVKLSSKSGESELYIGGTNVGLYVEDTLTYTAVTNESHWQVNLETVTRNGSTVSSNAASIIDTGTTVIIASDDEAEAYFKDIPGSSKIKNGRITYYTIPCETIGSYTPTFTFGSRAFKVSEDAFNFGGESDGSNNCIASIASLSNVDFWIIGDVFLRNVYTVFDMSEGSARVGFAELV